MSQRVRPPSQVLLSATSPLAAEMLVLAWSQSQNPAYQINYESGLPPAKRRLIELMSEQRFLTRLAEGSSALPDPVAALSPMTRALLGISAPKTLKAQANQVISLLEWYVEPVGSPPLTPLVSPYFITGLILLAAATCFVMLFQLGEGLALAALVMLAVCAAFVGQGVGIGRQLNAYTLYLYLYHELSNTELLENAD